MNYLLKSISPQTSDVYELLIKHQVLTAMQIGVRLDIIPNAVYRSVKPLIELGCVETIGKHPVKFSIKSPGQALDSYLLTSREDFLKTFFPNGINALGSDIKEVESLDVSFIKNRNELIERSTEDIKNAKNDVKHIVSGLEVPPETILAFKQAFERGVKLRFLVQKLDEVNKEMLKNWKRLGIDVKYLPLLDARIIIIDFKIVYLTSYNHKKQDEAVGVRFNYLPIVRLMNELFEAKWRVAKVVN